MNNEKLEKILVYAGAGIAAAAVPVFFAAPGHAPKRLKMPFNGVNCAHRGLHSQDKSIPENSLAAFRKAAENGYGVELDVQLSKDGQVVVFHDDTLKRVCGVDKRVDELTLEELQALKLCGTEERVPLFTQVLSAICGRGPIICELKTGRNNRELCRKTLDIIEGYSGDICIESFDPCIVAWFRFHAPHLLRGQLSSPCKSFASEGMPKPLAFILSRCLMNPLARPQFIAYEIAKKPLQVKLCEAMGAMKVCWTSLSPSNEKKNDCVIFQFYRPERKFK